MSSEQEYSESEIDEMVAKFATGLSAEPSAAETLKQTMTLSYSPMARVLSPDRVAGGDVECFIVNCLRCGSAVFIDPRDTLSPAILHNAWHAANAS